MSSQPEQLGTLQCIAQAEWVTAGMVSNLVIDKL